MAESGVGGGYLGTSYPVPTDASYYLGQTGLGSLEPQAFNANTLMSMMAPQGMQYTPVNSMATNPFMQLFLQDAAQGTKLQREKVPGMENDPMAGQQQGAPI